jgi:leader peptidase (prepilin peptidase) / N-methyltransferase
MGELPPPYWALLAVWVALVGAAVGSFLNVVIARVPAGESIVRPGSRCPRCRMPIRWYDNLPIVSWLALRARCRSCGASIPIRYPLVEALGAAAALVVFGRHGLSGLAAAELAFVATLIALAFIDLDTWLLPDVLTWSLLAFAVLMGPLGVTPATTLRHALYGAGLGFGVFAALSWLGAKVFKKEALGFGDVWLLSGLGAWMGPAALLPVVLLASLQGSIVGIALVLLGKGEPGPAAPLPDPLPASRGEGVGTQEDHLPPPDWIPPKNAVPFGPFLVAGALEWLWLGDLISSWIPTLRVFR